MLQQPRLNWHRSMACRVRARRRGRPCHAGRCPRPLPRLQGQVQQLYTCAARRRARLPMRLERGRRGLRPQERRRPTERSTSRGLHQGDLVMSPPCRRDRRYRRSRGIAAPLPRRSLRAGCHQPFRIRHRHHCPTGRCRHQCMGRCRVTGHPRLGIGMPCQDMDRLRMGMGHHRRHMDILHRAGPRRAMGCLHRAMVHPR
mmetsp:Transcript_104151/g.335858  ORF Transcript_104151/g.335858 Transcript_104151/m.335858 type:complete len:200 (-) Transcript_104151:799-1398(-)